jgi:hypothetical protein
MSRYLSILILVALCCLGCDTAKRQQQAEDARRAATVNKLREIGQSMHEQNAKQLSPSGTANDTFESPDDSNDIESEQPSTPDSSDALGGGVDAPGPTE